ncbi:Spy/CpxP family protein refolding chaperone [Candidatus Aminicenantes bacterium AC-335-A11]|nr:Spy/CpxP family protein refolding chaperone [Candidatus Aminicenantes bacterium AC-335-A11]
MKKVLTVGFTSIFLILILFSINSYAQKWRRPFLMGEESIIKWGWLIDLTEEQKSKLEELRKRRVEQLLDFHDKMGELRLKLKELLKDPEADEKEIESLIDEISKLKAEHFKGMLRHKKEIRAILTPEQLEKLNKLKKLREEFAKRRLLRNRRFFRPGLKINWLFPFRQRIF